jgi:hypothetical protein
MSDQYDRIVRSFDELESVIRFVREQLEFPLTPI